MATRIYLRVSSLKQREASQLPDLKNWVEDHPYEEVIWYRDKFTGKTLRRPGWSQLQEDLRRGDRVLVWKLDRLGRKAHEVLALAEELEKAGITFESLTERLDFTTPLGRAALGVALVFAQLENENRTERVLAGQAAARDRGVKFGRPKGTGKPLKVSPEHRRIAHQLKSEGMPIARIARTIGLSRDTIYRVLDS
jgi:DNA invertase Pin-like site-specific DNA recombinase